MILVLHSKNKAIIRVCQQACDILMENVDRKILRKLSPITQADIKLLVFLLAEQRNVTMAINQVEVPLSDYVNRVLINKQLNISLMECLDESFLSENSGAFYDLENPLVESF